MSGKQRGFVHSRVMDLAFLLVLILAAFALWNVFATLVSGEFTLAFFMLWLMAGAMAWWWCRSQPLLLRMPMGLLVFLGLSLILLPLSWWSGSKLVIGAEAAVLAVAAPYFGKLLSLRLAPRMQTCAPWYLDQQIDLVADLFRWAGLCIAGWFTVGILPLALVFVMPAEWVPWTALLWGACALAWYLYKLRPSRLRFLKIPLGVWVLIAAAVLLQLFQKQFVGPLEPGSIGAIAYVAYAPVVIALFAEIVVVGTLMPSRTPAAP